MALGLSGSGGGMTLPIRRVNNFQKLSKAFGTKFNLKYVDYFINNQCNIKCTHCYVGFPESNSDLNLYEWVDVFDFCLRSGVKVFGLVGKEPLLSWPKTKMILRFFEKQKASYNTIKFGIVTNGLLLDEVKIRDLNDMGIDYLDISLEGDEKVNDNIRGNGTFKIIYSNIECLSSFDLVNRTFINITLNNINKKSIPNLIEHIYPLGVTNFLISPYLTIDANDKLVLSPKEYGLIIENILEGKIVDFNNYPGLNLHIRNDYASLKYQEELLSRRIIDLNKLYIDSNDAVFQIFDIGKSKVYMNLQTWCPDYWYGFRISHDGYISNCFDMFFEDYKERAIGNVKEQDINEILQNALLERTSMSAAY